MSKAKTTLKVALSTFFFSIFLPFDIFFFRPKLGKPSRTHSKQENIQAIFHCYCSSESFLASTLRGSSDAFIEIAKDQLDRAVAKDVFKEHVLNFGRGNRAQID